MFVVIKPIFQSTEIVSIAEITNVKIAGSVSSICINKSPEIFLVLIIADDINPDCKNADPVSVEEAPGHFVLYCGICYQDKKCAWYPRGI